jgi:hypothetical protein
MKMKFDSSVARAVLAPHSNKPVVAKILAAADKDWAGDVGCAMQDAADGILGPDAYAFVNALPKLFGHRPMTEAEEALEASASAAERAAGRERAEKAKAKAREELDARIADAEKAGRVIISWKKEDTGSSYYEWDTGAVAVDEAGFAFARRGAKRDGGVWHPEK